MQTQKIIFPFLKIILALSDKFITMGAYGGQMKNESGRSMTEMLGVLAVVATLSVLGLATFKKAMNYYRTNNAVDSLMSNATIISGHKMAGNPVISPTLDEGIYSMTYTSGADTFTLTLLDVPPEVCSNLKAKKEDYWENVVIDGSDCSETADMTFTFNNDMAHTSETSLASQANANNNSTPSPQQLKEQCTENGGKFCDDGCHDFSYVCQCPSNGRYGKDGATCCDDQNHPWRNNTYTGYDIENCGCPYDVHAQAIGQKKDGVCCYSGRAWNATKQQYYDLNFACGCPLDLQNGLSVRKVGNTCCTEYNTTWKSSSSVYEGNDEENCGCPYNPETGAIGERIGNICCSGEKKWTGTYWATDSKCNANAGGNDCPADTINNLEVRKVGDTCCNAHNKKLNPYGGSYDNYDVVNCGCPYDEETGTVGELVEDVCCSNGKSWANTYWKSYNPDPKCQSN